MRFFCIFSRKNKLNIFFYLIFSFIANIFMLLAVNRVKSIFVNGINDINAFKLNILLFITLCLLVFVLNMFNIFISSIILQRGIRNLTVKALNDVSSTNYSYFIKNNCAELNTAINMSSQNVAQYFLSVLSLFNSVITFIIYFIIIFNINIFAGLLSILFIPVLLFSTIWANKRSSELFREVLQAFRGLSSTAIGTFKVISNIKAKNEYNYFENKINEKHKILNDTIIKGGMIGSYINSVSAFVVSIAPIIIVFLLSRLHLVLSLNAINIIIIFSFLPLFITSAGELYSLVTDFFMTKPNFESLGNFCDLEKEITGQNIISSFDTLVSRDLRIIFESGLSLKVPDFEINKGDKVLILGESGIGKSSLFNIIVGLMKEYSGSIKINDNEIRDININTLRNVFGILLQNPNVFSMTLEENIQLSQKDLDISQLINITELTELNKEKGNEILTINNLSGGEKARIGIAMNLAKNPDILLLDESLSSLDEKMQEVILKRMIKAYPAKTMICISHSTAMMDYFNKVIHFN